MDNCLFCRIINHEVPGKIVYEDEAIVAIQDAHPQAPVHLLVLPRKHLQSLNETAADDEPLLGRLFTAAARLARERGLDSKGYRTVINTGAWAGQSIYHLHVHVLGGRAFHWPPG
jgi:histidine triad (HIT) family protein